VLVLDAIAIRELHLFYLFSLDPALKSGACARKKVILSIS
jgi:hypothetical protein